MLLNYVVIVVKPCCVGGLMEEICTSNTSNKHSRYSSDVPFYDSFFTDTLYHGEQCTLLELPQKVDIHCIETKLNTTYIDIAVFVFRVSILILSVQCVPIIKFQ